MLNSGTFSLKLFNSNRPLLGCLVDKPLRFAIGGLNPVGETRIRLAVPPPAAAADFVPPSGLLVASKSLAD